LTCVAVRLTIAATNRIIVQSAHLRLLGAFPTNGGASLATISGLDLAKLVITAVIIIWIAARLALTFAFVNDIHASTPSCTRIRIGNAITATHR